MMNFADFGREVVRLDPSAVGLVIALFVAALGIVFYLYLRDPRNTLLSRFKASALSILLSSTIAAPILYLLLSSCTGYCGF